MDDVCAHEMQVSNAMLNTRVLDQSGKIPGQPENSLKNVNEGGEVLSDGPKTSNPCRR